MPHPATSLRDEAPSQQSQPMKSTCMPLLLMFGALLAPGIAQGASLAEMESEITSLFRSVQPGIVKIQVPITSGKADSSANLQVGTGFVISAQSEILTTHDLVGSAQTVTIISQDRAYSAQIVASDPLTNIALLKAPPMPTHLRLGDSDQVEVGAMLVLVGCAFGAQPSPALGMLSARDLHRTANGLTLSHLRTTLSVAAGQIGGPVLNLQGEAVGMIVAGSTEPNIGYALPINAVAKIRNDLSRWGRLRQPWLGFTIFETFENQTRDREIRIGRVLPNTPAALVQLQPEDRILAINGRPVSRPADVLDFTFFAEVGSPLQLTVQRGPETLELTLHVEERQP